MKQKLITFLRFFLFINASFAQQSKIDSLKTILISLGEDTVKVDVLNKLAFTLQGNNPDEAMGYGTEALTLSEKLKFDQGKADSYNEIGLSFYNKGEFDSALIFHNKSLVICESNNDQKGMGISYNNIGNVYFDNAEYELALKSLFHALEIRQALKDKVDIATTLGNIGNVYHAKGEDDKCLKYYFQSLSLHEETGDQKREAIVLRNIGIVYLEMNRPEKVLPYYLKSFAIVEKIGDKKEMAAILNNLGNFYHDQGYYVSDSSINETSIAKKKILQERASIKFDTAISYYQKSLAIRTILGDKKGIADSYNNIGNVFYDSFNNKKALEYNFQALHIHEEIANKKGIALTSGNLGLIYFDMKDYKQAANYFLKQLALANAIENRAMVLGAYEQLADCFGKQNDYKKAYEYHVQYSELKDSTINAQSVAKIAEYQTKYETERKDKEIANLNKDKAFNEMAIKKVSESQTRILWMLAIVVLIFFLYINRRRRKEVQLNNQFLNVEMKSLRSQMNPHFISNSLNSIDDYIHNNDIENSSLYINKFSRLMRMILESSRMEEVSLKDDLEALELYIQLENLRMKNKVVYTIDVSQEINQEQLLIPPMLLQPFVENAFKHAFEGIEKPKLEVAIFLKDKMLHFSVRDNGIGRQKKQETVLERKDKNESLGLRVTQERLDIINKIKKSDAHVVFNDLKDSENKPNGTKVELTVSVNYSF